MSVYVALLRAIGPVSHAKMRPSALRDKAEAAGFADPVNYLATGNLILGSDKGAAAVKREITALVESFGLTGNEVFVASRAEIRKIIEANPFPAAAKDHPSRLGVCFFHRKQRWPVALLHPEGPEQVVSVGASLVIDYGAGSSPSRLHVEKRAGARMTQRVWNTVLGIWERMKDR